MKVKVYVFKGIMECERHDHWMGFIDYEDTPSKVYERYAMEGEELPHPYKPIVHEEMVGEEDGIQKWVKSIVCCK